MPGAANRRRLHRRREFGNPHPSPTSSGTGIRFLAFDLFRLRRETARFAQRCVQQRLDLYFDTAELDRRPALERVVQGRIETKRKRLAICLPAPY